jgi:hypothetical protein
MGIWYSKHMCSKQKTCFDFFKLIRQLYYSCPMKRTHFSIIMFLLASVLCFLPTIIFAQQNVGIGTTTPNNSAILDLTATNKGLLVPRMTTAQRIAIVTPATGLLVYDTNFNQFWYFDGTMWVQAIGPMGPTGPQGITGSTGLQGPTGQAGLQGVAGPTGQQGLQGVTGPTGQAGIQGVTGPTGQAGIQGATGPSGTDGAQGPTGLQGIQGVTGPSGLQGIQGITGPSGIDGAQGPTGIQGIQGVTGPSGADGAQGPTGLQGATGLQGPTGADGALNAWALLGNTGTTPGTGAGQNFLGTTDAQDMIIATNNTEHLRVESSGDIMMTGDLKNQEINGEYLTDLFLLTGTSSATATMVDSTSLVIEDGPGPSGSGVLIIAAVKGRGVGWNSTGPAGCYSGWCLVNMLLERSVNDPTFAAPVSLSQAYATSALAYGATGGCNNLTVYFTIPIVFYDNIAGIISGDRVYYRLRCYSSPNGVSGGSNSVQHRSLVAVQIKR